MRSTIEVKLSETPETPVPRDRHTSPVPPLRDIDMNYSASGYLDSLPWGRVKGGSEKAPPQNLRRCEKCGSSSLRWRRRSSCVAGRYILLPLAAVMSVPGLLGTNIVLLGFAAILGVAGLIFSLGKRSALQCQQCGDG